MASSIQPPSSVPPGESDVRLDLAAGAGLPDDATVISNRPPLPPLVAAKGPAAVELGRLLAGERLDHFELLEYVGGGGMGAVFRARDTLLNREVALKVLSRDQGNDEETRRRFQNEAQSAARLDHENIARVHYVGEDRGLNYIVFEFIQGVNLRELVQRQGGPLPLAEAISYTLQIARALEHASSRDVVHRDIKPSNVLVTSEGKAKLVDMGLARLHQVDATGADLTASGVTLGTFDYISPEQARDPRSADVRSDLYSLGCTLYFMLTARPPFPEGTVLQKLLQHNSDEPPDPRELNPELPEEVTGVLSKLLAKNPRARYQRPSELIADLTALADRVGLSAAAWGLSTVRVQPPEEVPFVRRQLPWLLPVAALLAIVGAVEFVSSRQAASVDREFPPVGVPPRPGRVSPPRVGDAAAVPAVPSVPPIEIIGAASPGGSAASSESAAAPPAGSSPTTTPSDTAAQSAPAAAAAPAGESAAPPRAGLLVVSPGTKGPGYYTSLRAAASAARNGDVIELRFDGPRDERPLVLNKLRVTIRAGEGFSPTVVFHPDEIDPLRYPRSMITVAGGRLSLINVALQLDVPSPQDIPSDTWSLLQTQRAELVELHSCVLSIRNGGAQGWALHPGVAFFDISPAPGQDSMMATSEAMPEETAALRLENCVVRGEAVFARVAHLQPLDVSWENGLLASSERFLVVDGGASPPRSESRLRVVLRHLTAAVGQGFCQWRNSLDASYLLPAEISCTDSILRCATASPLIEQEGVDSVAEFQRQFTWNGDRNFYDGFDREAFWRIVDYSRSERPHTLSFADWELHWGQQHEFLPTFGSVAWKRLPGSDRPPHERTPADYSLSTEGSDNMAHSGASDGRDVGLVADLLPALKETRSASLP